MSKLSQQAAEKMIMSSIGSGGGTSMESIITWVFGKKRTTAALERPKDDPEFVAFALKLDAKVNKEWKKRGIDRHLGPYVTGE
jgi:hypothetical protein